MPAYKRQHFLPTSYLKYFSEDQTTCDPQSWIWRFDGKEARRVPVRSQCFGDYFYSKKNPWEIEQTFSRREEIYSKFVDKIRLKQEPNRTSFGDLFLCMTDIFLRNRVHKNLPGEEGVAAYNSRLILFFSTLLLDKAAELPTNEAIKTHIQSHWRMEIIPAPEAFQFVTSDNPSLFCTSRKPLSNGRSPLQLILLPLDPAHIAIAFDRRFMWIQNRTATAKDVRTLNHGQIQNAVDCIYKSSEFSAAELAILYRRFSQKDSVISEVTSEGWRSYIQFLAPEHYFSFMKMKPPLL